MTSIKDQKPFYFHQKAKSISTKISFKDFSINTTTQNSIKNNSSSQLNDQNQNYKTSSEKKNSNCNLNLITDNMKQNILELYYDNNSNFKNQIDDLNLKFYLGTEKYLKNTETQNNQKLQANLFMILFQQINILLEEIERLNKIIIENKSEKQRILKRTNELTEKTNNLKVKEDLITLLKKSNNNIEKRLLEALLHEDKLIKDNQRLRQENETYKNLQTVFEKELKNYERKNGSLSPKREKFTKHIKTYSDFGITTTSQNNRGRFYQISLCEKDENKNNKKNVNCIKSCNQFLSSGNKKKNKSNSKKKKNNKSKSNSKKKINLCDGGKLVHANTASEETLNKNIQKVKNKNKKNEENDEIPSPKNNNENKQKKEKDVCSLYKINSNNKIKIVSAVNNMNATTGKNTNNKKILKFKKIYVNKENPNTANNINNNNIINNNNTNTNEQKLNSSFEKKENKNSRKTGNTVTISHIKKRTMSNISFNEIITVQILNGEFSNTITSSNSKAFNKIKENSNFNINKSLSNKNKCKTKKNNNNRKANTNTVKIQENINNNCK